VRYYADLHVHSKYSRACSRDCDLFHLAWWARRKGITVIGTGDVTHPAWAEEIRTSLVPAENGLFKLRDDLDREVLRTLPPSCHGPVRFQLEVEISTIYKRGDRTRKVHHLCHLPDLDAMAAFTAKLATIGNLGSDGRPILGLDSRDLLEITLEAGDGAYLVPAHVWTPWFAVLGSKSGFDTVDDCYVDLAEHVFALETGLSSNPELNWQVSSLDRFHLVSNSDAHSPPALGRNATVFDTELGFTELRTALATGDGYVGTVDMFPEEGKYSLDGHRKCGVRMEPAETKAHNGICPECGKPLTVGVTHRISDLADRPLGRRPDTAGEFRSIVPLPEIMGEILGVGPKSKTVRAAVDDVVNTLGPELAILLELPLDEIRRAKSPLLTEAIERLRSGRVYRDAGYDGEYGVISLFEPGELSKPSKAAPGLFDVQAPPAASSAAGGGPAKAARAPKPTAEPPRPRNPVPADIPVPTGLDPDQAAAAEITEGPLLIVAGPGTGKTRTLTHRLAGIVTEHGVPAAQCLAITFTRRACEEMRERLVTLLGDQADDLTVATFHRLGLDLLRERHAEAALVADFAVADEVRRTAVLRDLLPDAGTAELRRTLEGVSRAKRTAAARFAAEASDEAPTATPDPTGQANQTELAEVAEVAELAERYDKALHGMGLVDFDDLLTLPVRVLSERPDIAAHYQDRFRWVCVDEYQDVDELQYRLLRLLCPATGPSGGNLCAIGDPDQAIYAFRGADVGFFLRFRQDWPSARLVALTRNYRSSPVIVASAVAAISPTTLVPERALLAMRERDGDGARITVRATADADSEARFVVHTIEELLGGASFHAHDSGRIGSDGARGGLSFDDIAILYRTGAQARPLMAVLAKEGLPFQRRSHDRLRDHAGVRALVPYLTEANRPGETTVPLLRAAGQRAQQDREGADDQVEEIRTALELLGPLASRHAGDPSTFLAELALGSEVDTWDPRANRISLLTLHAAKGLEFPVVFIVGCADGLLPLRWPGDAGSREAQAAAEAEERRLFFVGVSRAQAHLYLSNPLRDTRPGRERDLRASPFLAAFDDRLAERVADPVTTRTAPKSSQLRLL
jgi:DNA helicase II / ATP-dependent DNA helicase PcrA